jgi:hypothetical protein
MHAKFCSENIQRDYMEDLGIDGIIPVMRLDGEQCSGFNCCFIFGSVPQYFFTRSSTVGKVSHYGNYPLYAERSGKVVISGKKSKFCNNLPIKRN